MEDEMIEGNQDFFVTESTINKKVLPEDLLCTLRARKMTGRVEFHYNQGGLRRIVVVETTAANERQRDKIRQALGME